MANWGIISTGNIAGVFASAINSTEGASLVAVGSRDAVKARTFAEKFSIPKAYGSYEELAKDKDVEVVYIATPMSCHFSDVLLCLKNNKHVLCEKSVTLNSDELKILIDVAKENKLFFMEAMWTKFLPAQNKAKEWINEGKIGDIKYLKADFCVNAGYNPESRLFKKELGGGAMLDLGVYCIAFACDFLGNEPKAISVLGNVGQTGVDFDSSVMLMYENNGACLNMGFSSSAKNTAVIFGEKGKITFDDCFMNTRTVKLFDSDGKQIDSFNGEYGGLGYEFEVREVESCLKNGDIQSSRNPLSDTLAVMNIMDTCRRQMGVKYDIENREACAD